MGAEASTSEPGDLILAVDPGVTTGWALYGGDKLQGSGESPIDPFLDMACQHIKNGFVKVVVCEDFIITTHTGRKSQDGRYNFEEIGVLRRECRLVRIPFELQMPSRALKFVDDAKLRRLDWYVKGGHARDAVRHLVLYLHERGTITAGQLIG
jgi:hypothetical protein